MNAACSDITNGSRDNIGAFAGHCCIKFPFVAAVNAAKKRISAGTVIPMTSTNTSIKIYTGAQYRTIGTCVEYDNWISD